MSEQVDELKKLTAIATDVALPPKLRADAIEQLGRIGSHEAMAALLGLVADERLARQHRELALKQASQILKLSH